MGFFLFILLFWCTFHFRKLSHLHSDSAHRSNEKAYKKFVILQFNFCCSHLKNAKQWPRHKFWHLYTNMNSNLTEYDHSQVLFFFPLQAVHEKDFSRKCLFSLRFSSCGTSIPLKEYVYLYECIYQQQNIPIYQIYILIRAFWNASEDKKILMSSTSRTQSHYFDYSKKTTIISSLIKTNNFPCFSSIS